MKIFHSFMNFTCNSSAGVIPGFLNRMNISFSSPCVWTIGNMAEVHCNCSHWFVHSHVILLDVSYNVLVTLLNVLCSTDKWSPALQIRTVLLSIQALLSAPNPDDPLANDVAEQWKANEAVAIKTGYILLLCSSQKCFHICN